MVLVVIEYLKLVADWLDISPSVTVYCDNQGALNYRTTSDVGMTPPWSEKRNIYLKLEVKKTIEEGKVKFKF